jgi:hypothetical protein
MDSGPIALTSRSYPVKFRYEVQNDCGGVVDDPDVIIEG